MTLFFKAAEAEKGMGIGFVAAEALEEDEGVFSVAAFEDVLLIGGSRLGIEDAFLFEEFPSVGFENLAPEIGVIA